DERREHGGRHRRTGRGRRGHLRGRSRRDLARARRRNGPRARHGRRGRRLPPPQPSARPAVPRRRRRVLPRSGDRRVRAPRRRKGGDARGRAHVSAGLRARSRARDPAPPPAGRLADGGRPRPPLRPARRAWARTRRGPRGDVGDPYGVRRDRRDGLLAPDRGGGRAVARGVGGGGGAPRGVRIRDVLRAVVSVGSPLRVVVVSNGNAFSTTMIRPLVEDPSVDVAGALIVSVPSGRGGSLATLWRLTRRTGVRFATYKALSLAVPAIAGRRWQVPVFLRDLCRSRGVPARSVRSVN